MDKISGLTMAKVTKYAEINHWMNLLQIDKKSYGEDRDTLMNRLDKCGIQTRPVWTLNHLQKPFQDCQAFKIEKAKELVSKSLCLPSSTNLTDKNIYYVIDQLHG